MTIALSVSNNATGSLEAGINTAVSTLNVKSGEGAMFPTTAGAEYFYVTLQGEDGAWEVVRVTERAGDAFTIVRNIDSSTGVAQAFLADDIVSLRPVASIIADIITELNLMNPAGTLTAPAGTKMPFYQAAAPTGWTIIGAVADVLLGFKGGSSHYDDDAGTLVGAWAQTNHTHTGPEHTHTTPDHALIEAEMPSHTHETDASGNHSHNLSYATGYGITPWVAMNGDYNHDDMHYDKSGHVSNAGNHTHTAAATGGNGVHNHGATGADGTGASGGSAQVNTDRPYTALCIMAGKD